MVARLLFKFTQRTDLKAETPGTFQFELPTHSRYEVPQLNSTVVDEVQPWPVVFWACQSTEEEKEAYPAPGAVETVHLGYETIFPKNTVSSLSDSKG